MEKQITHSRKGRDIELWQAPCTYIQNHIHWMWQINRLNLRKLNGQAFFWYVAIYDNVIRWARFINIWCMRPASNHVHAIYAVRFLTMLKMFW